MKYDLCPTFANVFDQTKTIISRKTDKKITSKLYELMIPSKKRRKRDMSRGAENLSVAAQVQITKMAGQTPGLVRGAVLYTNTSLMKPEYWIKYDICRQINNFEEILNLLRSAIINVTKQSRYADGSLIW
jgi:hypothetical protein